MPLSDTFGYAIFGLINQMLLPRTSGLPTGYLDHFLAAVHSPGVGTSIIPHLNSTPD